MQNTVFVRARCAIAYVAYSVLALGAGSAFAVPASFDRILAGGSVLSNGEQAGLLQQPVMNSGRVLFSNGTVLGQSSLQVWDSGSIETIVSVGDLMPEGSAAFERVQRYDMVGDKIVYTAFGSGFDIGLFEHRTDGDVRLADRTSIRPDGSGLSFPLWTAIDSDRVVVTDLDGAGRAGVYGVREGQPLERIYDYRVPAPLGNPPLDRIGSVGAHAGTVVFQGRSDTGDGVYSIGPTQGAMIAQTGQFVSGLGFITGILDSSVSYRDGIATFGADLNDEFLSAVMIADADGSNLRAMATLDTLVPGRDDGTTFRDGFAQFGDTSTHSGSVVFEVNGSPSVSGLYFRDDDGFLSMLVNPDTLLDGRSAFSFDITGRSLDGTSVAFVATFDNGDGTFTRDLYIARIPTPATAGLLALGVLSSGRRRW